MIEPTETSPLPDENRLHFCDADAPILLKQVSQLRQHQLQLEQQAGEYHQAYLSALGGAERELIDLKLKQLKQWLDHLASNALDFAQHQQLAQWVINDALALRAHGLADPQPITKLLHELTQHLLFNANQLSIPSHDMLVQLRQVLTALLEHASPLATDDLLNLIDSPEQLTFWLAQRRIELEKTKPESKQAEDGCWQGLAKSILRDKPLQKLYKRLAHQLHPDKEQDAARKAQKQVLMQQLLRAKKRHDLSAILSLYQQHAKQSVRFDLNTSQAITQALEQQGIAYSQDYRRTLESSTSKMWAWRRFSQVDQPLTNQLQQAKANIQQEKVRLTQALAQGSQVENLKLALQQQTSR